MVWRSEVDRQPFAPPTPAAVAHEAVFGARYPNLLVRDGNRVISFRHGEYRTSDPAETDFLLRVVADESRGNNGVWVRQLPPPPAEPLDEEADAAAEPEVPASPAARAPRPAAPKKSKRGS